MKKKAIIIGAVVVVVIACVAAALTIFGNNNKQANDTQATQNSKVQVVASFYPMYDFTKKIGGDRVEVTNLVPAGTEPHEWEPSTDDMKTISKADLLVYNGAGMEHWVEDVMANVGDGGPTAIEASKGAHLLEATEEEEEEGHDEHADEHGHDHGQYDPHVWLSPENAKQEMANIRDALVAKDPAGADTYNANYEENAKKLDELDKDYKDRLGKVKNKTIVVSHEAYGYLCDAYGLKQVPIEGMEADSEPDAKTMAEIVDYVKKHKVTTIFSEELVSKKIANTIADSTGAKCEELNPIEGLAEDELNAGADYFSVMKENLDKLEKALS